MLEAFSCAERARAESRPEQARGQASRDREAELAALADSSGPLRRALARVAGRMVAKKGWGRPGFARVEDYATELLGISGRELRDLALVNTALQTLPEIEAAFVAGRIGWTQARLLSRAAQPDDEREWLALALQLSARALAREVRAVDRRAREAEGERLFAQARGAEPFRGPRITSLQRCLLQCLERHHFGPAPLTIGARGFQPGLRFELRGPQFLRAIERDVERARQLVRGAARDGFLLGELPEQCRGFLRHERFALDREPVGLVERRRS